MSGRDEKRKLQIYVWHTETNDGDCSCNLNVVAHTVAKARLKIYDYVELHDLCATCLMVDGLDHTESWKEFIRITAPMVHDMDEPFFT